MTDHTRLSFAEELSAARKWWMDAGVDMAFEASPQSWLASERKDESSPAQVQAPASTPPPETAPQPPALGGDPANYPQDLEGFSLWWRSDQSFETGGIGPRIGPRGPEKPLLMVLVAEPEADDNDRLLSGPQGRLLDGMLRAMGMPHEQVYFASALPRPTPLADWVGMADSGLREITRHHIGLVSPERLLVLGRNILPLTGNDPTKNREILPEINHGNPNPMVFAGWDLATLLARAKARSNFWREWLNWTEGRA